MSLLLLFCVLFLRYVRSCSPPEESMLSEVFLLWSGLQKILFRLSSQRQLSTEAECNALLDCLENLPLELVRLIVRSEWPWQDRSRNWWDSIKAGRWNVSLLPCFSVFSGLLRCSWVWNRFGSCGKVDLLWVKGIVTFLISKTGSRRKIVLWGSVTGDPELTFLTPVSKSSLVCSGYLELKYPYGLDGQCVCQGGHDQRRSSSAEGHAEPA